MNKIHPTAIIDENVVLGDNNEIGAYTVIEGPTTIGNNNIISHHVVIGSPGEDTKDPWHDSSQARIEIGDHNIIREFTAIQKPCYKDITKIQNNVFLMHGVHVPHDTIIEDRVVVTPLCVIGGITTILEGANIGMSAQIHQYSVIGQFSLVAMGSALTKNVRPFTIYIGQRPPRVNLYALKKFGFEDFEDEISKYVVEGTPPQSDELLIHIDRFEKLHVDSKRKLYS